MEGNLDDLIRYLLVEIALCGQQGANTSDIAKYVENFYVECRSSGITQDEEDVFTDSAATNKIDRPFQNQVWGWLTRHPEIRIGRDGQGNSMSLGEVEAYNDELTTATQLDTTTTGTAGNQLQTGHEEEALSIGAIGGVSSKSSGHQLQPKTPAAAEPLQVFTSEDRMWYAVAGHSPDLDRVPRMDFICLSIIATHREKGILQPELIRVSGQDKRSVPARTDRLQERGYIVKQPVLGAKSRTSLCILKRYVEDAARKEAQSGKSPPDERGSNTSKQYTMGQLRETESKIREMFDILTEVTLITWYDLKRKLGVLPLPRPSKVLAFSVRRMELLGCVQRVRAPANLKRPGQQLHRCVKLIRSPDEADWKRLFNPWQDSNDSNIQGGCDDAEDEVYQDYHPDDSMQVDIGNEGLPGVGIKPLLWTPDRPLANFLHGVIDSSGTDGLSINQIRDLAFGDFYSRPLEHQLSRLVGLWQLSQPLHLRRMAIIRDSTVTNRIAHYIHYTHDNFKAMVENGKASWEAVETVKENKSPDMASTVAGDAIAELDDDGFPRLETSKFQGRTNSATLLESIQAANLKPYRTTRHDPIAVKLADDSTDIRWVVKKQPCRQSSGTASGLLQPTKPAPKRKETRNRTTSGSAKPKGRPRIFPKLGLGVDADGLSAQEIKRLKRSQKAAQQYENRKIEKEIEERVESGEPLEQAREDVLAEIAAQKLADGVSDDVIVASNPPKKKPGRPKSRFNEESAGAPNTLLSASVEVMSLHKSDAAKALPRAKGQRRKPDVPYFPSVAAHTFPTLSSVRDRPTKKRIGRPRKVISIQDDFNSVISTPISALGSIGIQSNPLTKKKASGKVVNTKSAGGYFPSIAAHTFVILSPVEAQPISTPKRRGGYRSRKLISDIGYFPSVAAHTIPCARSAIIAKAQPNSFTKPSTKKQIIRHFSISEYLPSIASHTHPPLKTAPSALDGTDTSSLTAPTSDLRRPRSKKRSVNVAELDDGAEVMTVKPLKRIRQESKLTAMTYWDQAQVIQRASIGIRVGPLVALDRPGRGRPPKSRLAVCRSSRLNNMDWFTQASSPTQDGVLQTAQKPRMRRNTSVSRMSKGRLENEPAVLPARDSSSQSLVPGTKRKRTLSSAAERRRPPVMGFFDNPALDSTIAATPEKQQYQQLPLTELGTDNAVLYETATADARDVSASLSQTSKIQSEPGHTHNLDLIESQINPVGDVSVSSSTEEQVTDLKEIQALITSRGSTKLQTSSNLSTSIGDLGEEVDIEPTQTGSLYLIMPLTNGLPVSVGHESISDPTVLSSEQLLAVQSPFRKETSPQDLAATAAKDDATFASVPQDVPSRMVEEPQDAAKPASELSEPTPLPTKDTQRSTLYQTDVNQAPVQAEISTNTKSKPRTNGVPDVVLDDTVNRSRKKGKKTTITKMTPTGGSMGVLRKNLILEIVEKCGGVFPGGKELWNPFTTAWTSRNLMGHPDPRTIKAAQKLLVDAGKLRQLIFTYQNKYGIAVTKTIITLGDMSSSDPKIKKLQDKMIAHDPQLYIPEQAEVSQIVRKTYGLKSQQVNRPTPSYLPVDESAVVQLQYIPAYVRRAALNKKAMEDQRVKKQLESQSEMAVRGREGSKRSILAEERRIRQEEELGEPDFAVEGYQPSTVNLSSEEAGTSEFQLSVVPPWTQEARVGLKPIVQRLPRLKQLSQVGQPGQPRGGHSLELSEQRKKHGSTRRNSKSGVGREQTAGYGLEFSQGSLLRARAHADYLAIQRGDSARLEVDETQDEERYRMLDSMAWGDPGPGYESKFHRPHRQVSFMDPLGMHSNFDRTPSPEPEILELEAGQPWLLDPTLGKLRSPGNGDRLRGRLGSRQVKVRGIRVGGSKSEGDTTTQKPIERIFQPVSIGCRLNWEFVNEGPSGYDQTFQLQQVSTLMDPDHVFHPSTGTFSVNYSVIRDSRLDLWVQPAPSQKLTVLLSELEMKLLQPLATELPNLGNSDSLMEEMNKVMLWELNTPGVGSIKQTDWRFINHTYPDKQQVAEQDFSYRYLRGLNPDGSMKDIGINRKVPDPPPSKSMNQRKSDMPPPARVTPGKRRAPTTSVKNRRLTTLKDKNMPKKGVQGSTLDADGRIFKRIRLRGPRRATFNLETEKRIMVAVTVVRVLTGGVDRIIDWTLLATMFAPDFTEKFIHKRWSYILQKYRAQMEKLQEDFQELFAQAYEDGLVPPLDYTKVQEYDWKWLIDWTIKNILNTQIDKIPELPPSRSRLDETFELQKTIEQDLTEFYELNHPVTIPKRYVLVHKDPFVVPIASRSFPDPPVSHLDIAKSWVKANIVTPEDTYRSTVARQKLGCIGEDHIETALNQLLLCKTLSQENRGRLVPGRNYDISEHFLNSLRRNISVLDFKRAVTYKAQLDSAFRKHETVEFSYHADDGTVMAVLNLIAHSRIHLTSVNPPMKPFGLTDGGYMTRHMDRSRMTFTIALTPTPSYVYENPLLPLPRPPSSHPADTADPTLARIPIWYDINGALVPVMWDLALAAVLGILAVRPGVGRDVVRDALRGGLEGWEVELLIGWLADAGVSEWVGEEGKDRNGKGKGEGGVRLGEWWWCVVGMFEEG